MKTLMIFTGSLVILFLSATSNVDAHEKGTTKPATTSASVPQGEIDLTGSWTYERDDGRGDKGTFELKRDAACDEDGWLCFSGQKKKAGDVLETKFWVKADDVRTELGGSAAPCVGGVNQAGWIVLSCRFLNTGLGTLTAKRDQSQATTPATMSSPTSQGKTNQKDPNPAPAQEAKSDTKQTLQPSPTAQPQQGEATDLTGDWVFTTKFSGKPVKRTVRIIRDDNLEAISVSAETRDFFKKEYPGFRTFAATTQEKDGKVSESWIVLMKGGELQLRTKLFGCVGILTVESTPAARIARAAKGTCLIPSINESGSLEAIRSGSIP